MMITVIMIPEELMEYYQGDIFVKYRYLYFEINKVMHGLPQAGVLENKLLQKVLTAYGFSPTPCTPGLWQHDTITIQSSLVVDDFEVEYEWN